jgi:hypothetical protein
MSTQSSLRGFIPEYPRFSTQTKELRATIADAIQSLPEAHRTRPVTGEAYDTPDQAYERIKDWGFIQGMYLVKESANNKKGRWQIECSRHHPATRNVRETPLENRVRLDTHSEAHDCKFGLYISKRKRQQGKWVVGWTHELHNHPGLADPFSHPDLKEYQPFHRLARQVASSHRGILCYGDSKAVLKKQGLKIGQKEFYNLTRREEKQKLSPEEELTVLIGHLERHGYHPRTRDEYIIENGVRTKRIVRDIFFMSDEQIRLARRFVSGFIYETDATFNTNTLRLPLSVMVGIDNTGHTFPMAFMYITSESAKSFVFASEQLTDLCFYNCPEASIICGDFSKGLGASIALKARLDLAKGKQVDNDGFIDIDDLDAI